MEDRPHHATSRDFKGAFIPKDIWCNPELSGDGKLMWGEIFALDNDFGCIASNERFMEMFGFNNDRKAQRIIKTLKDKGYITVEIVKRKDVRVMRVVGKYRHLDDGHMSDLAKMRAELTNKLGRDNSKLPTNLSGAGDIIVVTWRQICRLYILVYRLDIRRDFNFYPVSKATLKHTWCRPELREMSGRNHHKKS